LLSFINNLATVLSGDNGGIKGATYLTTALRSFPLSALEIERNTFSFTTKGTFGLLPNQTLAESTISFFSNKTVFLNSLKPQLIICSDSTALFFAPLIPFNTRINLLLFWIADAATPCPLTLV